MTVVERMEQFLGAFYTAIGAAVAGGVIWIVRTVFTNHKQVELLKQEMKSREEARQVDREALTEIRTDIREVKADVKELYSRRGD